MSNEEDLEALARLVDPNAWREPILPETYRAVSRDESLMEADAILAAGFHRTPAPAPDAQTLIDEAHTAESNYELACELGSPVTWQSQAAFVALVRRLADALEASAVPTPRVTDAMVEAAYKAALENGAGQLWKADVRAALEAALGAEA